MPERPFRCRVAALAMFLALMLSAAMGSAVAAAQLLEPVDAEVSDGFRPPAHIGAPGNRGLEYVTTPGSVVVASDAGVVAFAGQIGRSLYVSIDHANGLRTTYSHLGRVLVARGDHVARGMPVGTAGEVFHFGVRRGDTYLDPAQLFGQAVGTLRARLVPVAAALPATGSMVGANGAPFWLQVSVSRAPQ